MPGHLPELLTPEQVADYLQMSVDEVVELLVSGEMPGSRLASKWRIRKGKLDEWIDSQSVNGTSLEKSSAESENLQPVTSELTSESNGTNLADSVGQATINNGGSGIETEAELETSEATKLTELKQSNSSKTLKEKPKWEPPIQPFEGTEKKLRGTVTRFNSKDGYGFIKGDDGRTFYVSSIDIAGWGQSLRRNEKVEFESIRVPQGWAAKNVVSLSNKSSSSLSQSSSTVQQVSPKTLRFYTDALVAKEEKDLDRARRLFEQAIQSGPSLNVFQAYAAMEEKEANRVESALKVLERGIRVFPEFGALYNDKAMLLRKRRKLQDAVETLQEGLKFAPAFSKQLHWSLAQILIELGDAGDKESLNQAYTHAEEAKKLGMPLEDDPRYKKLRLSKEQNLGHQALDFFSAVGIETRVEALNNDYADILITSQHLEFTETYDLKGRILARCFLRKVQKFDLDNLLQVLREPPNRYRGINSDIAFIILDDSSSWKDALYRIIGESREAVVPLDKSVFDQAQSEDIVALLRQLLDQWLSRRDLFKNNAPVSGRRFFGRETELQNLMRNIDDGQHTGIYGLRKVGKTSLMYQLQEKRPQDLVVYIDLQQIPSTHHDCAYVYWSISRQLQDLLDQKREEEVISKIINLKLGSKKKYSELNKPEKRNALHFAEDIDRVMNLLSSTDVTSTDEMTAKKIVIAIDELEYMLPITASHPGFLGYADFFAHLRGIAQKTKGKLVSVVAAANPMISEQATWEGRDNPVFQFYKDTFLPPLTKLECDEMLEKLGKGMSISFDQDSLNAIYSETGGHPYITRQLCSHIIGQDQSRPLTVTHNLVVNNLDTFLRDKSDVFREILDRLDYFPQEKDLLCFIAEGLSQESELASLVTDPIDIALRHLIGYQIVDYESGHYKIKINLLNRWLQRFRL
ncbi:MAG: helix-turn-helix domain-containing protein [Leptolyngbyaceae cyanobacterium]